MAAGKGVRMQRYKDGGVADAKVFKLAGIDVERLVGGPSTSARGVEGVMVTDRAAR